MHTCAVIENILAFWQKERSSLLLFKCCLFWDTICTPAEVRSLSSLAVYSTALTLTVCSLALYNQLPNNRAMFYTLFHTHFTGSPPLPLMILDLQEMIA